MHRRSLIFTIALAAGGIMSLDAEVVFTNLHSFSGLDGGNTQTGLVQDSDGNFYGTTQNGGAYYEGGTIFKISPGGEFTNLYSFNGYTDDQGPPSGLVKGIDGNFYGTTIEGGASNLGTVFQMTTNGTPTYLHSFSGPDGQYPATGVILAADGKLYGTTKYGGSNNFGTIFMVSTNGEFSNLYSFTGGSTYPGVNFNSSLIQGSDGYFYGTTQYGGPHAASAYGGAGTVFKISSSGELTNIYYFTNGVDGGCPQSALVQGSDGNFYGTTGVGGTNSLGAIFKITAAGVLTPLYSFTNGLDGNGPMAALIQASDGNFYGTASGGGAYQYYGTIFRITANGAFTPLYSCMGGTNAWSPESPLLQGSDGSFYGTTVEGGKSEAGTVFRLSVVPPAVSILIDSAFGFTSGTFGFNVTNTPGATVVVQSSPDLQNWNSVQTNAVGGGEFYFSDPQPPANRQRFYRAVAQ